MLLIKKLREEKRTNEEFEIMLKHLSLEEIFFLRLELEDKAFSNNLSGFRIFYVVRLVIEENLVKFALNLKKTKTDTKRFLGINIKILEQLIHRHKIPFKKGRTGLLKKSLD